MRWVIAPVLLVLGGCSSAAPDVPSTATHADAASSDAASSDSAGSEGGPSTDGSGSTTDAAPDSGEPVDGHVAAEASPEASTDAGSIEASIDAGGGCFVSTVGVFGECLTTAACVALGDHTSTPGYCRGATNIECCTTSPNVADNPPVPAGWQLMQQSAVTPAMTTWAVTILDAPTTYPMFSTATQTFGTLNVLARVEWHPPDFQNTTVHRGVTLYQPV